jgi:hypothetical protein
MELQELRVRVERMVLQELQELAEQMERQELQVQVVLQV